MKSALARYRLGAQRLVGEPLASPDAVVGHLGAVQSQLPDMALWAIGRRCGATLAEVSAAFERGDFVRTHVLRPTWHDVLREDLGDLLAVTGPRIERLTASGTLKRFGLKADAMVEAAKLVIEAVTADGPLTRAELGSRLDAAGFPNVNNALAHHVMNAELTGRIHNGPIQGKQHTYAVADLPDSGRTEDERLVWIAETYGRGHGPFRDKDLAWWTSLTLTQARRAIELAELASVELNGEIHFTSEPLVEVDVPRALLLANFDEFISYARDPEDYTELGGRDWSILMRSTGLLFVDGALAGSWTRRMRRDDVDVRVETGLPLGRQVRAAIEAEAERYGAFVERAITLQIN